MPDFFDENPPPEETGAPAAPPANDPAPGQGIYQSVADIYRTALGRDGSADEINGWIQGTGGNIGAIQQAIYASPEAQANSQRIATSHAAPPAGGSGGPQGGNFQAWFQTLAGGKPPSSATLKSLEPELAKYGISLAPNAQGINSKIKLPSGEIVRVGNYFDSAPSEGFTPSWGWTSGGGATSSGASGGNQFGAMLNSAGGDSFGGYSSYSSTPWGEAPFQAPVWGGGDFHDPTMDEVKATPGYQIRLDAGQQARERSAAAQGSVLSGGTQKALERYGQDYATGEYGNARANSFQNYNSRYGQFADAATLGQQAYQNRYNTYLNENSRTLSDYITNATSKRNSELDMWARLRDLYQTGANTAAGSYRPGT
jgi:hypothetical protein